jgi:uncharacterized membrane protein YdbT with pleckstrin-like domain
VPFHEDRFPLLHAHLLPILIVVLLIVVARVLIALIAWVLLIALVLIALVLVLVVRIQRCKYRGAHATVLMKLLLSVRWNRSRNRIMRVGERLIRQRR